MLRRPSRRSWNTALTRTAICSCSYAATSVATARPASGDPTGTSSSPRGVSERSSTWARPATRRALWLPSGQSPRRSRLLPWPSSAHRTHSVSMGCLHLRPYRCKTHASTGLHSILKRIALSKGILIAGRRFRVNGRSYRWEGRLSRRLWPIGASSYWHSSGSFPKYSNNCANEAPLLDRYSR
jgi:hypothetical protein